MIVSWNWLKEYVKLDMEPAELEDRLSMSGLCHEASHTVGDDLAVDLEVTSNRPDWLGHIGIAREVAVLYDHELKIPAADVKEGSASASDLTKVTLECPESCYRYTARVIQGIKVGPSPDWLAKRLEAVGIAVINNIVDISNYVLMECGQPLHTFDFAKLDDSEIIVRHARDGEEFLAIDHRTYKLDQSMCVIADARRPVAIGGVMGGAETEISDSTTDLLIEAAEFDPLSIRSTARKLSLHSDSSYRFERGVDPAGVDWASRRCCELILEIAGGELASGVVDVGREIPKREPVVLRLSQLPRILGIEVNAGEVQRILTALGCKQDEANEKQVTVVPPSWRRDLTREVDLIEEVARIHGYDKIPEDAAVPMAPSHRSDVDRVLEKVRQVLTAAGFDEAMTCSLVPAIWSDSFSPWSDAEPIGSEIAIRGVLDRAWDGNHPDLLRRSLVPSLLEARRYNESRANTGIELFETSNLYLPNEDGLPTEPLAVGITSGSGFGHLKGVVEAIINSLSRSSTLIVAATDQALLDSAKSCELQLDGQPLGYVGEVTAEGLEHFQLRRPAAIAELNIDVLASSANLIPQHTDQSPYPAISRDFNFILDESVSWAELSDTIRHSGADIMERIDYQETFRDPKRDGAGKKRVLLSVTLRSADRTLTSDEAEQISKSVVDACAEKHGATLVA